MLTTRTMTRALVPLTLSSSDGDADSVWCVAAGGETVVGLEGYSCVSTSSMVIEGSISDSVWNGLAGNGEFEQKEPMPSITVNSAIIINH